MKKMTALFPATLIVSFVIFAIAGAQSGSKRRTPALTTDDLGPVRESVSPPTETEGPPPVSRNTEVVRGAITWHRDLRKAMETAKAEDKIVVVDVYTDWCGWCKKMDRTIYADPVVVALSRQQIFVKVDAEDRGQGQSFAQQMRVKGYPTTIFLDSRGNVLNVARGYIATPRAFEQLVQDAVAQAR